MEAPSSAARAPGTSADRLREPRRRRRAVVRDALAVGVATGAYGLSFGALAAGAGLSLAQTAALSLLMFTGASQFALVGILGAGGGAATAAGTAVLLGTRNAFYGMRLAGLLRARGIRRLLAAQLVIDESTAMAVAQEDSDLARLAFWATGAAVFLLWNLATLTGALGAAVLASPQDLGLDAAAPAAFLALLAPRLRGGEGWAIALAAALGAVVLTPVLPAGMSVLAAALGAVALVMAVRGRAPRQDAAT
jgi:predicted branched-subunit amino acid permease